MPVNTDRTITANRPDVIVNDSVNSTCKMIDMTIAWDTNIAPREIEKKSKYKDLKLEIQRMWQMKNRSDPCCCWCAWYSKEGDGRIHQESIRESYCYRGPKDLHAGICTNLQEWLTWVTDAPGAWFAPGTKRTPAKTGTEDNYNNYNFIIHGETFSPLEGSPGSGVGLPPTFCSSCKRLEVLSDAHRPEVDFFALLSHHFKQNFWANRPYKG